ncbi:inactive transglutaminase family protein [Enterovibrio paralichthyis]|uniref:inactive transglutaminase family protein n=1 Tax=Enterovibrio paralichthyis TaxID=2853805 RepID=UPI001C468C14|nr:inactive transglutaminase family protein [Enterovibrio paralichthyis]MBV7299941.1 inactive transglutaminase family protein [Enterovibrio paralichthyis]
MTSRVPFYMLISLLIVVGLGMSIYRHDVYGVPWTAGQKHQVWEVEARVEFEAKGEPVKVSLATPDTQSGFTLINEHTSSPGYGFALVNTQDGRRAEWSKREATGQQILYFKNQMLVDENAKFATEPPLGDVSPIALDGPLKTAAEAMLEQARQRSADNSTLTRELIKQFNEADSQNASLLTKEMSKADAVVAILSLENIHARVVGALQLEDGRRRQSIISMVEIWDGSDWQLFNLDSGSIDASKDLLIWNEKGTPLLEVVGGTNSQVSFSIISQDISPQQATDEKIQAESLLNFSIHSLPIEEQAMFKTIMLIPIGALIVVMLRVLVGLKTSGTFMPVLIAVAFVQTQLVPGVVGFLLIVGTGLVIRSYLSRLNLLLVARISAVIITVILIISVFTVVAFKIGLIEGLSITFFPMIILSWTIERMSILWEEEGAKQVIVQGGGSLLTAVLVYLAMTNEFVRHITFNFIGIQLVILAVILMLGNYTGYRLSELKRFKPLVKD